MFPNYYKRLGLNKIASKEDIKKAFRQLALQYHPDRNKSPDAEQIFIEVNEAYLILYDVDARQKYDKEYEYHFKEEHVSQEGPSYQQEAAQNNSSVFDDSELNNWAKNAREQGNEYAKMTFDEFSKMVIGFVKETGFHIGNTLLVYVGIFLTMGGCGNLVIGLTSKGEIGNPVIGIILLPIGILIWRLANRNWEKH